MARTALIACAVLALAAATRAGGDPAPTPVDHAKPSEPEPGRLATTKYSPAEREKPFLEKLPSDERTTGSFFSDYSLKGKKGKFVGWFGIVRKIEEDPEAKTTRLLVEMKYFDGLTDTHQQIVSINGAGDFRAMLRGTGLGIEHLSLVKVYGNVVEETEAGPVVEADYVRHFDWGTFAFMAYGNDTGNPDWRKLLTVPPDRVYAARPGPSYYEARLGKRRAPALHERLGGEPGLAKLAAEFFIELRESDLAKVEGIAKGLSKVKPEELHARFAAYVGVLAGGPEKAAPEPVEDALRSLGITVEQWSAALGILGSSLEAVGIREADRKALLDALAARRDRIVGLGDEGK